MCVWISNKHSCVCSEVTVCAAKLLCVQRNYCVCSEVTVCAAKLLCVCVAKLLCVQRSYCVCSELAFYFIVAARLKNRLCNRGDKSNGREEIVYWKRITLTTTISSIHHWVHRARTYVSLDSLAHSWHTAINCTLARFINRMLIHGRT